VTASTTGADATTSAAELARKPFPWQAWLLIAAVSLSPFLLIGIAIAGMAFANDPMAGT
jgi:hypothetical protein